ncbi:MAG: DUF1592 domain-containing protein [Aureliella sp.]
MNFFSFGTQQHNVKAMSLLRNKLSAAAFAFTLAYNMGCVSQLLAADGGAKAAEFRNEIAPLLDEHCYGCHSGSEADAGLALDHFDTPLSLLKGRSVWKRAVQKMSIGEMPPPDSSDLSDNDRKKLINWITTAIDDFECGLTPNPGQVTLRRLNASEYQNTIRDLLGVNYSPAADFPGDDIGYGFDNIGDVLTLPPMLMEKYLLAAERITRFAIQTPPPAEKIERQYSGEQLEHGKNASTRNGSLTFVSSSGIATLQEQIPWPGKYTLTITASGDQAGNDPCVMVVGLDDKAIRQIEVPNSRENPGEFRLSVRMRPGNRKIQFGFANDFYQKGEGGKPELDRNLVIHHVHIAGQKASNSRLDPNKVNKYHKAIIFEQPRTERDVPAATRKILNRLASRAFRRPVAQEDLQRLEQLAAEVREDGSFEESIQVALQAILISPKFLFRVEPPASDDFSRYRDLDQYELATRLSYFLWSSMPDDELLALAWKGRLREPEVLRGQIQRMVEDNRSNELVKNFASQWLTLRRLKNFRPNKEQFPNWSPRIEALARFETLKFFHAVMRGDMSILRLLDAKFTYLNEELANYYGIDGVSGTKFQQVSLEGIPRGGILTQASVLAVTSNPTRTSPVKRGKWILDNLLASPPPPAPAGVPELKEKGQLTGTMRQQLEQHRADPACAGCHKLMDPLGFALENFDAVGLYRTEENGLRIDASGLLPDGTQVVGAEQLRDLLATKHKQEFVRCLTEKMLTYALGRGLEYYDKCAVDKMMDALERDNHKFSTLLFEIVSSDPFQKKGVRSLP